MMLPPTDGKRQDEPEFHCPNCGDTLESRHTRRAARAEKRSPERAAPEAPPITRADLERCAEEWNRAQEQVWNLGVLSESHWALDWAERLLAELRRRIGADGLRIS
jgi:hypothetical protein